eukprot:CAMPEP_0117496272 /NCGR_PEP_ID=MMETSP0784-20121206/20568_1 /TAXON_ID=39447 /ORGANISM="" /LENGTH=51 /DNA_ID=CAMNT_0005291231 /DNA_START=61 /DNA_END=213 /DNA_ORIENTATION=+
MNAVETDKTNAALASATTTVRTKKRGAAISLNNGKTTDAGPGPVDGAKMLE